MTVKESKEINAKQEVKKPRVRSPNKTRNIQAIFTLAIETGELENHTFMCLALDSLINKDLITAKERDNARTSIRLFLEFVSTLCQVSYTIGTLNSAVQCARRFDVLSARGKSLVASTKDRHLLSVEIYSKWALRFRLFVPV